MKVGDEAYYIMHAYTGGKKWALKVFKVKLELQERGKDKFFGEIIKPVYGSFFSERKGARVHIVKGENLFISLEKAKKKSKSLMLDFVFSPTPEGFKFHNLDKLIKTMNKAKE